MRSVEAHGVPLKDSWNGESLENERITGDKALGIPTRFEYPHRRASRIRCLERAQCEEPAAAGTERFKVSLMAGIRLKNARAIDALAEAIQHDEFHVAAPIRRST